MANATAPETKPDEVGWLFVQQYYTMMNKTPSKLHLFYTKRSSFVHGVEGETVKLAQGQQEIHDRISDLNLKDCKVLVSNVDSQASLNGAILIQVLGEISNDGQESRKFGQTFCLAPQESGYYVYNDIFRFLKEDVDSEADFEAPPAEPTNGTEEPVDLPQETQSSPSPPPTPIVDPEPEKSDPVSTPPPAPEPEKASAPLSWAARAASSSKPTTTTTTTTTTIQPQPAPKKEKVVQVSDDIARSAFLKNISARMSEESIRSALSKFGHFKNVELNRAKNCGFVDFIDPVSCAAAIKSNKVLIDGETMLVEERRRDVAGKVGPKKQFDKKKKVVKK